MKRNLIPAGYQEYLSQLKCNAAHKLNTGRNYRFIAQSANMRVESCSLLTTIATATFKCPIFIQIQNFRLYTKWRETRYKRIFKKKNSGPIKMENTE